MGAYCSYFPAYEHLMDDLRDYRFYAEDMLHPSEAATAYITDSLIASHFAPADEPLRDSVRSVRAAARHRHARPQSAAARRFAATAAGRIRALYKAHPHCCGLLDAEAQHFGSMLGEY
mmetsp:Transcript_69786/g.138347  ORF Transcript_69786/g.138347 Transcript_69786/m.138347 type:complete len:118 (-) Transcript_69786:85-438(-)